MPMDTCVLLLFVTCETLTFFGAGEASFFEVCRYLLAEEVPTEGSAGEAASHVGSIVLTACDVFKMGSVDFNCEEPRGVAVSRLDTLFEGGLTKRKGNLVVKASLEDRGVSSCWLTGESCRTLISRSNIAAQYN